MAKPDLIVFDVDGTLLDDGIEVPERSQAIMALAKRVPVLLSSGRSPGSLALWAKRWGLLGPHGACNGGFLTSADLKIEVLATLTNDIRDVIVDDLVYRGLPTLLYLADGSLRTPVPDERVNIVTTFDEPLPLVGNLDEHACVKIVTLAERGDEEELRQLAPDHTLFQRTHEYFVEWNSPLSSKGLALSHQIKALGLEDAHVFAVGDSENDASMLRLANHGIAVQHAAPEAKEAADEILSIPIHEWMDQIG